MFHGGSASARRDIGRGPGLPGLATADRGGGGDHLLLARQPDQGRWASQFFLLELLSLGGHTLRVGPWHLTGAALPWHWLAYLPLLDQALPNRLSIEADGAVAAVLAFSIDQMRQRLPAGRLRLLVPAAAALVLLPALPLGLATANVGGPPPSWQRVLAELHLPAGAPVLVLASSRLAEMQWQAIADEPISIVGGFCITSAASGNAINLPAGQAVLCSSNATLTPQQRTATDELKRLADGTSRAGPGRPVLATAIREWRAAAVITTGGDSGNLTHYLQRFFGAACCPQRLRAWLAA